MINKRNLYLLKKIHVNAPIILLYSDDYDGALLTLEAYNEVQLSMSTGDWHTHKAIEIDVATASIEHNLEDIVTLDDVRFEHVEGEA